MNETLSGYIAEAYRNLLNIHYSSFYDKILTIINWISPSKQVSVANVELHDVDDAVLHLIGQKYCTNARLLEYYD